MRIRLAGALLAVALLCASAAAGFAQEDPDGPDPPPPPPPPTGQIDDGDCDDLLLGPSGGGPLITGANNALTCDQFLRSHLTLTYQPNVIRNIVAGRLAQGPSACASLDREDLTAEERRRREESCTEASGFLIAPAAAPAQKRFNTWTNARRSWIDAGNEFSPTDGTTFNATGGADYRITDRWIMGAFGSLEGSDFETGGFIPSTSKTDGIGVGIYTGITLTPNIVFSGILSGAEVDTELDYGFVAAALDSSRVQASGSLTGYWYIDSWRVSPSATLAWSKEWQNPFVDSLGFPGPKQAFESAVLTVGNQVGRSFAFGNGGSVEPFAGYQFDWTFLSSIDTDGFDKTKYEDTYDLRVQAGVNWTIANGGSLSLTGEVGGLLMPDNTVYSGEVNYSIQF